MSNSTRFVFGHAFNPPPLLQKKFKPFSRINWSNKLKDVWLPYLYVIRNSIHVCASSFQRHQSELWKLKYILIIFSHIFTTNNYLWLFVYECVQWFSVHVTSQFFIVHTAHESALIIGFLNTHSIQKKVCQSEFCSQHLKMENYLYFLVQNSIVRSN